MFMPRSGLFGFLVIVSSLASGPLQADDKGDRFEKQIRPLLMKRCGGCHGAEKQQGGVRVDLRDHVVGKDGLVSPQHPDNSRLIQVVRYSGEDVQMPPKGKLPQAEIDLLTRWVQDGAHWPEVSGTATPVQATGGAGQFQAAIESHWSYRSLTSSPSVPASLNGATGVDSFIDQSLTKSGLTRSPRADRRTLIRRATFDLWGLPPTWDEVQSFEADSRPDAWERLIDRLLASPLYGQRWGRHWLDIARYADTKGYVFTENPIYPFAYTYRDYVVEALNEDKPYNRFVLEQLAADQLGLPENDAALAALGFITCGPRFLNREPDIIDDRIDLVTRGLMGLTVACARCHDHKYDPVPTADYYSLYGVFASSAEPAELPLAGEVDPSPGYQAYLQELTSRKQAVTDYRAEIKAELSDLMRGDAADYLLAVLKQSKVPGADAVAYEQGAPRDKLVSGWKTWLAQRGRDKHPLFALNLELAKRPAASFKDDLAQRLTGTAEQQVNARWLAELRQSPPQSLIEMTHQLGHLLQTVDAEWKMLQERPEPERPTEFEDPATEEIRRVLYGPGSISDISDRDLPRLYERDQRDKLSKLVRKIEEWQVESPDAPPRAMVLNDKPQLVEPVIFLRGDVGRRGDRVPRQAPRITTHGESKPFEHGSGRLELAQSIVAPDNPLTARVIVNRVWAWHFGRGLAATLSDFGARGDAPTHPELLDWLSWNFTHDDGWSLKTLHRRIMLSDVYRQSSDASPQAAAIDPENQLYWRFPRQRLEFESLRDSLLQVAGRLDLEEGGRPVAIEQPPFSNRRTIYAKIDRNNFSSLLRTFDYPSPDATSPGRPVTTVPQQALYGLNSPFLRTVADEAANAAAAIPVKSAEDRAPQIDWLYRRILSRAPQAKELELTQAFLQQHPDDLWLVAQSLMLTNEFTFVD
ncbi:MAG: DUF1553 domain-containing protein [Planctomycetaceae bacterium]